LKKSQVWDTLKVEEKKEKTANNINELEIVSEKEINKQRLEMMIDQGGGNLSVGQKQLICVARAFIKKPKVLVMDEATANIDEKTDQMVQDLIKSEFKDTTVITIAHRLNTIIQYDNLIVLKEGKLEQYDNPLNLLNDENGYFCNLVKESGQGYYDKLLNLAQAAHKN